MLAIEHSHQEHHFTQPFGYESNFHDSYADPSMNSYSAFEPIHSFTHLPYSTYESPSFYMDTPLEGFKSEMQRSSSSTGSLKPASHHSSELPPSTLSSASGHSIPSASSSTVGSPYSGHAHSFPHQESWINPNEGLGLGSALVNQEAYYQGFVGTDLDSELAFGRPHDKLSDDFVGECTNISSTRKRSDSLFPGKFSQSPVPLQSSLASSASPEPLTIDAILERANSSSTSQSPRPQASSQVTSIDNERSQSLKPPNLFKSPTTPASACPRTSKVATTPPAAINQPADRPSLRPGDTSLPHASTPSHHQAGPFQNHFFAQSSGSFVPPLESSCVFFLVSLFFPTNCSFICLPPSPPKNLFRLKPHPLAMSNANKYLLEQIHHLFKRREHR
jgi:hypothetical protein